MRVFGGFVSGFSGGFWTVLLAVFGWALVANSGRFLGDLWRFRVGFWFALGFKISAFED